MLAWLFGAIFFIFLLFWPAMALKGMQALYVELGWLAVLTAGFVIAKRK